MVALEEIFKKIYIFSIRFIYSIHVIKVYNDRFLGGKKSLSHAQIVLLLGV